MDNRAIIQDSIDYIEENLKAEISAQELADRAGFSLFHYYKLFKTALGMPVMQYIVRRKLLGAISEIGCGRRMTDTALAYGFDTHAGFYKAFRREFGYTPAEFLKRYRVKKPYKINLFEKEHIMMTHKKVSEILKNWKLENEAITDIFYDNGMQNECAFYVGAEYVIKASVNPAKLQSHISVSKAIERVGLFAATPVKTTDGREIVEDGELCFILTRRLQGSQIKAEDVYEDEHMPRFIGEIIGQLGLALKDAEAVVDDANIYETVADWALPRAKTIVNLPAELCKEYTEVFGALYEKLPKQIIHRDPNPGNIILAKDRWGFIDFELSERNIRIYDPVYASTGILSESFAENNEEKLGKWIDIYKNMIYGYDSVAKLSEAERKAVPYVVLSNQLVFVAWLSEQDKYKDILETNKRMTKWIVENFEKLRID